MSVPDGRIDSGRWGDQSESTRVAVWREVMFWLGVGAFAALAGLGISRVV